MKKYVVLMALLANALVLSGCGWLFGDKGIFRDRGDDYRRATVESPLVVPPGLSKAVSDEDFAIPTIAYSAPLEGKFEVPRPEPLAGNPEGDLVKIQRLDDANWVLVEAAPGEVWPRVRQFLTTNQLTVVRADATAGIIETAWLQPKADGTVRERYRFRIEQGVQRGSSEVYILQADSRAGDSQWPAKSSNPERETEMTKALAQFIADNGSAGAVSMLAQRGLDSKGKVFLHKAPGESAYLLLDLSLERAWASFTTALPKAGFTVEDTNRSERKVWVRYEPPKEEEEEEGWWSSFWSWVFRSTESTDIHKDVVYVLSMQPEAGGDAAVRIGVTRQDGKPSPGAAEEELLNRIKNKLS
jgi:outer membrane protein assembly factor BamC